MKATADITPAHLAIVLEILRRNLPQKTIVWVFGSRAQNKAPKKYSDLDLLIDAGKPISIKIMSDLANDFEESDLPYKVDLVDAASISDDFLARIKRNCIVIFKPD